MYRMCINIYLFTVQREQYPQLPEDEVKTKAHIWKECDEKEHKRRQAFYRDVLTQQQSVSSFFLHTRVHVLSAHTCTILMFQSYPSTAHTQNSGLTEQSEKSSGSDGGDGLEPARTDVNKRSVFLFFLITPWCPYFISPMN